MFTQSNGSAARRPYNQKPWERFSTAIPRPAIVGAAFLPRCLKGIAPLRWLAFHSWAPRRETPETTRQPSCPTIPLSVFPTSLPLSSFITLHPPRFTLYAVLCVALASACSTGPARVVEVTATRHIETVSPADATMFLTDRASRIASQNEFLPVHQRHEDFYVHWTGTNVQVVKFEYRRLRVPNTVFQQVFHTGSPPPGEPVVQASLPAGQSPSQEGQGSAPSHSPPPEGTQGWVPQPSTPSNREPSTPTPHWHVFSVRGEDFANGGPVSAWRVSLWSGGTNSTLLAEQTSAIW